MAIREELSLDLSRALSQLDDLERQLDGLFQPITIPVDLEGTQAIAQLERQIDSVEADPIDIDVDSTEVDQADAAFQELRRELGLVDDELDDVEDQSKRTGRELEAAGKKGGSAFGNLTRGIALLTVAIGAFRGAQGLFRFFGDSIQAASSFEESLSKTRVVFGNFSSDIEAFARTAPTALGLADAAALEFTATFGNLFSAMGITEGVAADLSQDIVQLGADLASFNNIPVTEALDKLRAGLVGEVEPLRVLGVQLNAAVVEAKALELGLVDASGAVTEAGKVQARYALIVEQTATAQGDFERTSEQVANRQRTLAAEFENVRREIGDALLPVWERLLDAAPSLLEAIENLTPAFAAIATSLGQSLEDSDGFLTFLVDLAGVAPRVGSAMAGIFGAIGDLGTATSNLIDGDIDVAADAIGEAFDGIRDSIAQISVNQLQTGLIDRLRAGEDAATALEGQLIGLRDIDLEPEQLGAIAAAFAQIAGVGAGEISRISIAFGQLGEEAGFTADEIEAIRVALQGVNEIEVRGPNFGRSGRGAALAEESARALITEAEALNTLEIAADDAGVSLLELLQDTENLPPEFEALADTISGGTLRFLESVERINELKNEIGTLPGVMEAAKLALRDEENEIVDDFSTFFDNLLEEIEKREAFESNLAILRAFGLDALADVFDAEGLEAASALADAVANPEEAARAEALLDGQYEGVATSAIAAMEEAIRDQPVTQALINNLLEAAAAADTPEVRAALLRLAEALSIEIPVTFGDPGTPTFNPVVVQNLPEFVGGPGAGGGGTVVNNFYTEPNPTTDTARVSQAVATVTGNTGGNFAQ